MAEAEGERDILSLSHKAFDESNKDSDTLTVAFKAVANTLLLQEDSRQVFADSGYAALTADKLRVEGKDRQKELIFSRILFLLTYKTHFDFSILFEKHSLAESICHNITFHAARLSRDDSSKSETLIDKQADDIDNRALSETLKLLFNLNQLFPNFNGTFQKCLVPLLNLLHHIELGTDPLFPPMNWMINALLNAEFLSTQDVKHGEGRPPQNLLFPDECPCTHTTRLVEILERSIHAYSEDALESKIVPLITLLRRINEMAHEPVRKELCVRLLPSDEERDQPLGTSNSLASKLLRLSTAPAATQVKEGVSSLLFELSDQDPATFVRNVGYGYAAGYLMTHKISMPAGVEDVGAKVTNVHGCEINPITGQRRDREPPDPGLDMSDEEKEREAERLFVLFERLKATGVMNVTNPVEQAMREGKLEEIESDEPDE